MHIDTQALSISFLRNEVLQYQQIIMKTDLWTMVILPKQTNKQTKCNKRTNLVWAVFPNEKGVTYDELTAVEKLK